MKGYEKVEKAKGFTLIELLVVIAIISILMTILLPAVMKGRLKSKKLACSRHLRDLYAAMLEYTEDYGGYPRGKKGKEFWEVLRTLPTPTDCVLGDLPERKMHSLFLCPVASGDSSGGEGECDFRGPSYKVTYATRGRKPLGADEEGNHGDEDINVLYFSGDIQEIKAENWDGLTEYLEGED